MAAVVLTSVLAFLFGGVLWLVVGSRMRLSDDPDKNDLLNLLGYIGLFVLPAFGVVFFLLNVA